MQQKKNLLVSLKNKNNPNNNNCIDTRFLILKSLNQIDQNS